MSPQGRYLSATVVLVALAAVYMAWQGRLEHPKLRLPAPSTPAVRRAPPVMPPTAREILERAVVLDLRSDQMIRLQALDRLWTRELNGLEGEIREAEGALASFVQDAQTSRGASVQEIQRRSAEFSSLSATLRARRQRHAEAALQLLDEWQRQRFASVRPAAEIGRDR